MHGLHSPGSSDSLKSPSPTPSHSSTLTQPLTGSSVSLISLAFSTPPSSTSEEGNSRISFQPTQIVPTPSVQSSFAPEEGNSQTSFQPTHTQSVLTSSIQPSTVPEKGSGQPLFTTTQTILVSALVAGVLLIVTCHWIAIISCCLVCRKKKKKVSNNDVSLQSFNKSTHTDISRSTEQQQKDAANPSQQNYMYQHQYMPQPINQSDGFSTSFNHAMQRENSPEYAYIGMPYQHTLMPAHPHPAYQPVQDDQEHIYY